MRATRAVVIALALVVSPATWAETPPLDRLVVFEGQHKPSEFQIGGNFTGAAWPQAEKAKVRDALATVYKRAPGILVRAAAYRPVRLYYPATRDPKNPNAAAVALQIPNGIVFYRGVFDPKAVESLDQVLAHELTHVLDSGRLSSSRRWRELVQPRMDRFAERVRAAGRGTGEAAGRRWGDALANAEGIPTAHYATSLDEALAGYAGYIYAPFKTAAEGFSVPAEIEAFIRENVMSATVKPDEALRLYQEGLMLVHDGKLEQALFSFFQANKADKGFADVYAQRAYVFFQLRQYQSAVTDATSALDLLPRGSLWAYNANYVRGVAAMTLGRAYAAAGNREAIRLFTVAIGDFTSLIEPYPSLDWWWAQRGLARASSGDLDGAIADFSAAIERNPKSAPNLIYRGQIRLVKKDFAGARADFLEALRVAPQEKANVDPWLKRLEEAEKRG